MVSSKGAQQDTFFPLKCDVPGRQFNYVIRRKTNWRMDNGHGTIRATRESLSLSSDHSTVRHSLSASVHQSVSKCINFKRVRGWTRGPLLSLSDRQWPLQSLTGPFAHGLSGPWEILPLFIQINNICLIKFVINEKKRKFEYPPTSLQFVSRTWPSSSVSKVILGKGWRRPRSRHSFTS